MQNVIRRDRLAQLALVVVLVAAAPSVAKVLFPSAAPYVPPFFLLNLVQLTAADVFLFWRTDQVVEWLCPGNAAIRLGDKELRLAKICGGAGIVIVLALTVIWIRSWP